MLCSSALPLPLAFFGSIGPSEMLVVAVVALLLYGGDLPEVARTWGKHFAEFRRHLDGVRGELNAAIYAEPDRPARLVYQPPIEVTPRATTVDAVDAPSPTTEDAEVSPPSVTA